MSYQAMKWSWPMVGVSPLAKLVAILISDGYPPFGAFYLCRRERLAEFTCSTESDVRTAIAELVNKTEMLFEEKPDGFYFWLPIPDESKEAKSDPIRRTPLTVYVISRGKFTKIGISGNALKRCQSLQWQSPEQKVKLEWKAVGPEFQIRKVERLSHAALAGHLVGNEWFAVTPAQAIDVVRSEMTKLGMKVSA